MAFLDVFTDLITVSAVIKREAGTFSNGSFANTQTTVATESCIFYLGGQSEFVLAEKIREGVDGTCIFQPTTVVRVRDELTINSINYDVIYVDNVALQGEAVVVLVQKKS